MNSLLLEKHAYPTLTKLGFLIKPGFKSIFTLDDFNPLWKRKCSYHFPLIFKHKDTIKLKLKKDNQKEGGRIGQQNGEVYKGKLVEKIMLKKGIPLSKNIDAINLLNVLKINLNDTDSISIKMLEDTGKKDEKCAKGDLFVSVKLNTGKKEVYPLSLKSTDASTQAAIHPRIGFLKDFNKFINPSYLNGALKSSSEKTNIRKYREANLFLYLFTNLSSKITNPCKESMRRQRHSIEEINSYNPKLLSGFLSFFEDNYLEIIEYVIFKGKNFSKSAQVIAFFPKKQSGVKFYSKEHVLNFCKNSVNKITLGEKNEKRGTTTFFIADKFLGLQMKGSGKLGGSGYKSLQFKITGSNLI